MKRRVFWLGAAALFAAAVWQLRPLILWHWTVRPELISEGREHRLHVPTHTAFPEVPAAWARVEVGALSFRAPLADASLAGPSACGGCDRGCALRLGPGRLTVFSGTGPPDFQVARDQLAADAGDLGVFRSRARNWHTLRSLADRALLGHAPPETFRFEAHGGKGFAARFFSEEVERFVLYTWSASGLPAPALALSKVERSVVLALIGTLRMEDGYAGRGGSRCTMR
ncbi:MAG: hypothetical protein ACR2PQ_03475 [Myxococcota bacterium]